MENADTKSNPAISFGSIASTKILASRLRKQKKAPKSLWEQAVGQLDDGYKKSLDVKDSFGNTDVEGILHTVNGQIEISRRQQWKIRKRNGKEYLVRDFFQGIEKWIQKFKVVGDALVEFDPAHAGVPWAVIRYLLSAGVDEIQKYSFIFEGVEIVSEFIARYAEIEKQQLLLPTGTSVFKSQLADKIVKLYVAILEFLADAKNFYSMSTKKRVAKSFIPSTKPAPDERLASVEKIESSLRSIVDRVEGENHGLLLASNSKQINGLHLRMDKAETRRAREGILPRLNATFTNNTYERALAARHDGTTNWIFRTGEFTSWMNLEPEHAKLFWIHGPPGFGKSVLSASIISHLEENAQPPAYFFCNAEDPSKQKPYAILSSWIAQLIEDDERAVEAATRFVKQDQQHPLSRQEQWDLLRRICRAIPHSTFVIDGYDECTSRDEQDKFNKVQDARSQFLTDLTSWLKGTNARILLVSRDTAEIRAAVLESPVDSEVIITEYGISPTDTSPDVQSFSRYQIESRFKTKKPVDFDDIANMVTEKADGMFLWVQLMSFKIKPTTTLKGLDKLVSTMPKGLEDTYQRDLDRICNLDEDERDRALMILRWVLFAQRPLTVLELIEVLAIDSDDEYPEGNLPEWWDELEELEDAPEEFITDLIRKPLGSLIQLQPESESNSLIRSTVHLVHYSVKEFLLQSKEKATPQQQQIVFGDDATENGLLARICIKYLCFKVFGDSTIEDLNWDIVEGKLLKYPFLYYASNEVMEHSKLESGQKTPTAETLSDLKILLDPSKSNWALCCWIEEVMDIMGFIDDQDEYDDTDPDNYMSEWAQKLAKWEYNVPRDSVYEACGLNELNFLKELHENGADLNTSGGVMGSPLAVAVGHGYLDIARYLIDQGVDTAQRGGFLEKPPIFYASHGDQVETFLLLLEHEENIGAVSDPGLSLLHEAMKFVDARALKAVIDKGADINEKNESQGRSAVTLAALYGLFDHLSILVDAGAEIEVEDISGLTPLHSAIISENIDCVRKLMEHNADVNHCDHNQYSPLHFAARYDLVEIAELLLDAGAELETLEESTSKSPLMTAAVSNSYKTADLLLHHGAQVTHSTSTVIRETAFDLAVRIDNNFSNLFWRKCAFLPETACGIDVDELAETILTHEAEKLESLLGSISSKPKDLIDSGLLHIATATKDLACVQKLLGWGVNPNFAFPNGRVALHICSLLDEVQIAECLIKHGADPTRTDMGNLSPMDEAVVRSRSEALLKCLIKNGGLTEHNAPVLSERLVETWTRKWAQEYEVDETQEPNAQLKETMKYSYALEFVQVFEKDNTRAGILPMDPEHGEQVENVLDADSGTGVDEAFSTSSEQEFAHPPLFSASVRSETPAKVYGRLIGDDEISFIEAFQDGDVWMYWGRVNLEDGSVKGEWGRTRTEGRMGTFEMKPKLPGMKALGNPEIVVDDLEDTT